LLLCLSAAGASAQSQPAGTGLRSTPQLTLPAARPASQGDAIVAIVNQDVITRVDVARRANRIQREMVQRGAPMVPRAEIEAEALEALINERVQVSWAKETGINVDDLALDRAIAQIAQSNQMPLSEFLRRVESEGYSIAFYREQIRDEMIIARLRERDVLNRLRPSDAEVEDFIAEQSGRAGQRTEWNVAQLLVAVPEGATQARVAELQAKAERLLARARAGEDFARLSATESDAANAKDGGELGFRSSDRMPSAFLDVVKEAKVGDLLGPIRTGAGFHVLKLVERRSPDAVAVKIPLTQVRHILLASGDQSANIARLREARQRIVSGQARFEDVAREISQDGSAMQGGDLGAAGPRAFVPEFEVAMNALAIGQVSEPVVSRFGVHLIQVTGRSEQTLSPREVREQARELLKERRADDAIASWLADLRGKAFVELRRD
jgi:peptidyl-prolyl cis-trans isomerase SurA